MSIGLNRHLVAKDKKGIRYCLVKEGARLDKSGAKPWSKLGDHFRNPDNQTVLDGPPLLCLFAKTTKLGIDHEKLTFYHNGLQQRLTGLEGHGVIKELLI